MQHRRVRTLAWASIVVGCATYASACSSDKPTELMVAVQTDLVVPKDLNAVTVRVLSFGAVQHEDTYEVGPQGLKLPATIGVVPQDPDNLRPIDIEIIGRFSNDADPARRTEKVIRKARLTFAKERVGLVRLPLRFSCYDKVNCAEGETCLAGACAKTPSIDGATLPEFQADQVFGAGSNGEELGQCWDTNACFAASTPLPATGEPCVFSLTAGPSDGTPDAAPRDAGGPTFKRFEPGTPLSIVLAKASPTLGFCAGDTCRVAIDLDPGDGWEFTDESRTAVRIGPGLCERASTGGWRVEATDACETKTPSLPYCATSGGNVVTDAGAKADVSIVADAGAAADASTDPDTSVRDATVSDASKPPLDAGASSD